ncbi:response regulator [Undibacterium sp. Tian12W]|uniref:response regulator n=1 Tax=Undibacterium sp. Tian12W TaxID=3413054 RepID=UPI003BF336C9
MNILLVEDEAHKREELTLCIREVLEQEPTIVDAVSNAVHAVKTQVFDIIVLDMALSTFGDTASDDKKGHDQAQGGIEVLRALKSVERFPKIIIVTQYGDFYLGDKKIKLRDSAKVIRERYKLQVVGAILYHYKSKATLQQVRSVLRQCL